MKKFTFLNNLFPVFQASHKACYRIFTLGGLDSSCILYQAKQGSVYAGSRNIENLDCSPQHYVDYFKLCFFSLPYPVFWQVRDNGLEDDEELRCERGEA